MDGPERPAPASAPVRGIAVPSKQAHEIPLAQAGANLRMGLIFAALLLLFWSGLFHLHPPIGWVDPGLYAYWFLNADQNAAHRVLDYHGARLSYVVPGLILYRIFEPVTAQQLLVSGYYLLGLVAIHAVAAPFLRGTTARAFVVIVVGANPLWIGTFAQGYVDGPCMALGLFALALLLQPAPPGPARHATAGALLVLAVCAHTLGGGMAGLTALAIGLVRSSSWRAALLCGGAAVVGALACLLALGLVAMVLGMPFLFPRAFLTPLQLSLDGTYDAFSAPLLEWMPFTPRLMVVPAIVILLAAGWQARIGMGRQGWALVAAVVVPLLPLCGWFLRTASLMQYSFYAGYLFLSLIPALVLFARRAEPALDAVPLGRRLGLLAMMMLVLIGGSLLPLEIRADRSLAWASWAIVAGVLLAALLLIWRTQLARAAAVVAVSLTLAGALNADTAKVFRLPGGPDNAAQHMGMQRLHALLREEGATQGRYFLWFGRDAFTERRGIPESHLRHLRFATTLLRLNTLDSLAASLGWHVTAVGFGMPNFIERWGLGVAATIGAAPVNVITLCADLPECDEGLAALLELGLTVEPGRRENIEVPGMPAFSVALARARVLVEEAAPRRAQTEAILARLALVDAQAADGGQPLLDPARRATLRIPLRRAAAASAPHLEEITCMTEGSLLNCRARYRVGDGAPEARRLVFERFNHLALLQAAHPAEVAASPAMGVTAEPAPR